MSLADRIQDHFQDSIATKAAALDLVAEPIALAAERMVACLMNDGRILACGNGGSAADAQHFAAEMVNRYEQERPALAAIALTTDSSILTSVANDYDFDRVFARQVQALGRPGDLLLAISTSGASRSVLKAVDAAHEREVGVIALTGRDGGPLAERLNEDDILICVPAENTARIQEVHLLAIHCLCDGVDYLLLGA